MSASWSLRCDPLTKACEVPSQHQLHEYDVEPAAELAADLAFAPDLLEAALAVQRDRRLVAADDPGDDGVESVVGTEPDDLAQQQLADALAAAVAVHVDGVLDRRRVRGAWLER